MSEKNTPGVPGQDPTSAPINPDSDLAKILAAIRGLSARLDVLEQRFEYLDRDVLKAIKSPSLPVPEHLIEERPDTEHDTEPEPEMPHVPTLALASDGRLLLSLHYLTGADIADRERWTGIILTEAEACDAASHIGGRLIALAKKKGEPEGSRGDAEG